LDAGFVKLTKSPSLFRLLAGGLCGLGIVGAAIASRFMPGLNIDHVESSLRYVEGLGPLGVLVFAAVQTFVAIIGLVPASLIGIAAGAIYGVAIGFGISAVSTLTGAAIAFGLSRSLLRPFIAKLLERRTRLRSFDSILADDGWKIVLLLRVSPVMPFAATSYALGLSSISIRHYLLGSLAALPALLGYVVLGSLTTVGLNALSQGSGLLQWALLGVGILATALITWRIGKLAVLAGLSPAAQLSPRD
jgi:uncharacterized membrane protein YdjX (TVP38/TMEM64 family)